MRTKYGYMGAVRTLLGLHTIILPTPRLEDVESTLKKRYPGGLIWDDISFRALEQKFKRYFLGEVVCFDESLDLSDVRVFERRVLSVVSTIPRGEVRSYDWVAKNIGEPSATRAVGQALSRNRLPIIIPCHRVVHKDGDIGGFAWGVEMKRLLLKVEGRIW
jgi:O-6-methylguanine DNA methyltransferase